MNATKLNLGALLVAAALWPGAVGAQLLEPQFIKVTPSPSLPLVLPDGDLLIGTRSFVPNSGRVIFVDKIGNEASILGGLPFAGEVLYQPGDANGDGKVDVVDVFYLIGSLFAGSAPPVPTRLEPGGMAARGSSLYVATGEVVPAGQKASPERGAVLKVTFSAGLGFHAPFVLDSDQYPTLLAGGTVVLTHPSSDTASVSLLVNRFAAISDLTIDETTGRLYIVSRVDSSVSWVPLQ